MLDVGLAGEFRIVVSDKDGNIKQDTGYQKNLILNQGLEFFGGGKGSAINDYCVIGSGNNTPAITQTKLDMLVAAVQGDDEYSNTSFVDKGDNLHRMWSQKKYRFTGLRNVNISEVGLASEYSSTSAYFLTTRALIKDSTGSPTTITVKSGEVLDIYYKIHRFESTLDNTFIVNMLDGDGGLIPYNITVRRSLSNIGHFKNLTRAVSFGYFYVYAGELGTITQYPSGTNVASGGSVIKSAYVSGSNKQKYTLSIPLTASNQNIRTLVTNLTQWENTNWYEFKMRFGSVADDSPIPKTANHTLEIPFEISWGRYEGAL